MKKDYAQIASKYAEKYGILEWTIKGHLMIYYRNYSYEHVTMKIIVDLNINREIERKALKGYYKKGFINAYVY